MPRARRPRPQALTALLILLAACGGTDAGRPTTFTGPSRPIDPGSGPYVCPSGLSQVSVEDFELGAAGASWFANDDVCEKCQPLLDRLNQLNTVLNARPDDAQARAERESVMASLSSCRSACTASMTPSIFDKPLPASPIPGGRCRSSYALHAQTATLMGWGGNVTARFTPARNASSWSGVAFWGRVAPGSRNAIRVELADQNTDPGYLDPDGLPPCNPSPTMDDLSSGCDKFGTYVTLNSDWQLFRIPFADLRQAGWGQRSPPLDLSSLRTLGFTFGPGAWNIWIDDVAFYR
jgi:hypothetical protein